MDDSGEKLNNIIDFAAKKAEKEKLRLTPEIAADVSNFLSWAYNAARPKDSENNPIKTDEFRAIFNNKEIKGRFNYERSFDESINYEEETVSFMEIGGKGRVFLNSVVNGDPSLWCFKKGPNEPIDMTPEEIMQFLKDLGAPHEPSDPFPFAPDLRPVK